MTSEKKAGRRAVKNYICNAVASVWEVLTDLTAMGLIARYLDPDEFGRYAIVMAFLAVFRMISGMGVPATVIREISCDKNRAGEFLTSALILQLIFSAIMFTVVSVLVNISSDNRAIIFATYLIAAGIIFQFLGVLFSSVINAFERMEFNTLKIVLSQTVYLVSIYYVKRNDLGFFPVFLCIFALHFTGFLVACTVALTKFAGLVNPRGLGATMKHLFLESYPVGIRRFVRQAGIRVDTLILAWLRTPAEVGLFHGLYKIAQGMMFVGENVSQAVFPPLSRYFKNSRDALDRTYKMSVKFLVIIGPILALFLFNFSDFIISLVLGPKYVAEKGVIGLFSGILVLMLLAKLTERVLIAGNRQKIAMMLVVVCLFVNATMDFFLIPSMGIAGAAWATLIAELILAITSFYYISKYITPYPVYGDILKTFFVYGIGWAIIQAAKPFVGPIPSFIGGILTTMVLLVVFRIVTTEEFFMIKELLIFRKRKKGAYGNGVTYEEKSVCVGSRRSHI